MPKPAFLSSKLALCAASLALISLLAACSAGEGESCQNDRDCDDGLVCGQFDGPHSTCMKPDDSPPDEMKDNGDEFPFDGGDDSTTDASTDDDAGN